MNGTYLRGEIYFADLEHGVGSEQMGYRPVLIIQNDTGNKYSPTVIVAAISSARKKDYLPTHIRLPEESGVEEGSIVMLEQLRTLDKRRLDKFVGRADRAVMKLIDDVLMISVGVKRDQENHEVLVGETKNETSFEIRLKQKDYEKLKPIIIKFTGDEMFVKLNIHLSI